VVQPASAIAAAIAVAERGRNFLIMEKPFLRKISVGRKAPPGESVHHLDASDAPGLARLVVRASNPPGAPVYVRLMDNSPGDGLTGR
jgi:hypothetical protein